jgi:hypothetical protein
MKQTLVIFFDAEVDDANPDCCGSGCYFLCKVGQHTVCKFPTMPAEGTHEHNHHLYGQHLGLGLKDDKPLRHSLCRRIKSMEEIEARKQQKGGGE